MQMYKHIPIILIILCLLAFITLTGPEYLRGPIIIFIGNSSQLPAIAGLILYLTCMCFLGCLLFQKNREKILESNGYLKFQIIFIIGIFLYGIWGTQVIYRLASSSGI